MGVGLHCGVRRNGRIENQDTRCTDDVTLMGNSAATHVATVNLTRDISGTAYLFKALHWIKGAVTLCSATSCQV